MVLCSHRKETSSIVCLGNLRRLTSKFLVSIGLMWNFKFDWSLFVSVSKRPGSQGYHLRSRGKVQPLAFFGLTLCSFSLFNVVNFSSACGWGYHLGWGFCIVEYSPVCRGRCSLDRIIGIYRIFENGGFLVFWNPGFSSMTLECWGLYRKLISLWLLYLYF
jgi:hypothetical protein